jgi:hypothetical protein
MTTEAESPERAIVHSVKMSCKEGVEAAQGEVSCSFLKRVGTSVLGLVERIFGHDLDRLPMCAPYFTTPSSTAGPPSTSSKVAPSSESG